MGMADTCTKKSDRVRPGLAVCQVKASERALGEEKLRVQQRKPAADQAGERRTRRRDAGEVMVRPLEH